MTGYPLEKEEERERASCLKCEGFVWFRMDDEKLPIALVEVAFHLPCSGKEENPMLSDVIEIAVMTPGEHKLETQFLKLNFNEMNRCCTIVSFIGLSSRAVYCILKKMFREKLFLHEMEICIFNFAIVKHLDEAVQHSASFPAGAWAWPHRRIASFWLVCLRHIR
ncbi:hypothetical protein T4B_13903 [Trichinella pseudospiralis]|uniref:Uncharacterized protein n=1 Tax=Trichinella pseudospiralis TaxID=6337 RepID=A0A0V1J1J4_TRIPS|nr:hypothetical protein T4B_13903 [Trichinella pseudospiralis]